MPTESVTRPLNRRLLRVVLGSGDVADRDLLARFATSRDEEAFAELVRRHGPMVLGVCRRVTGHPHDAEDAFQAAFIVLARRASQIRNPDQVANWLYGVAYRTALEARAARRRVQEHPVSAAPEPTAPDSGGLTSPGSLDTADLRRIIDEELAKLPDKYRSAVVLCDLEGLSRTDAATRLKIPEGTLSSRLAHARKLLAERLSRRGVTAGSGVIAATLVRDATAAVPRELVTLTARVAARATAGGAVPPDLLSPSVSTLADGVMKAMLVNRLRLALGAIVACGLLGLGAYGLAQVPAQNANEPFNPYPPPRVDFKFVDPVTGQVIAEEGQPTQPKQPMKVAAKGIEDDDVPHGASPSQAVVRVEDGKLIVRQRAYHYQPVTQIEGNRPVTSYQVKSGVQARTYDPADVSVFDMKGNRLQTKAWKDKLKADVHALVSFDGKLPQPRELALFKDDTLLVVLPAPMTPVAGYGTVYDLPNLLPTVPAPPMRTAPSPAFPGQNGLPPATTPRPVPGRPGTNTPAVPPPGTTTTPGLPAVPSRGSATAPVEEIPVDN